MICVVSCDVQQPVRPSRAYISAGCFSWSLHALQNSNLVLTAETRTREAAEPSGEPDSLWGRMKGKMGDRVQYTKPEGLEERKAKQKKK